MEDKITYYSKTRYCVENNQKTEWISGCKIYRKTGPSRIWIATKSKNGEKYIEYNWINGYVHHRIDGPCQILSINKNKFYALNDIIHSEEEVYWNQ